MIGRSLARQLMLAGHEVQGFDWAYPQSHPHFGDIRDSGQIGNAARDADGIIHLAAISRVSWGERDPALCMEVNAQGTANILDAANRCGARPWIIVASSREVYGEPAGLPVTEDAPRVPYNTYGHSKLETENLVEELAGGLRTAILRFANVYGSVNDHADRVVPAFVKAALQGNPLHVHGADNAFDFTHICDITRGIEIVAGRLIDGAPGLPVMHFASGEATTLGNLAKLAVAVTGSSSPVHLESTKDKFVSKFVGDPARAAHQIGFTCRIGLEAGLQRLAADMREPSDSVHTEFPRQLSQV